MRRIPCAWQCSRCGRWWGMRLQGRSPGACPGRGWHSPPGDGGVGINVEGDEEVGDPLVQLLVGTQVYRDFAEHQGGAGAAEVGGESSYMAWAVQVDDILHIVPGREVGEPFNFPGVCRLGRLAGHVNFLKFRWAWIVYLDGNGRSNYPSGYMSPHEASQPRQGLYGGGNYSVGVFGWDSF